MVNSIVLNSIYSEVLQTEPESGRKKVRFNAVFRIQKSALLTDLEWFTDPESN